MLSSNPPPAPPARGIIPLRSPAGLQDGEMCGGPPVGHAFRDDDVDGQHSRDLGWASSLLGMLSFGEKRRKFMKLD